MMQPLINTNYSIYKNKIRIKEANKFDFYSTDLLKNKPNNEEEKKKEDRFYIINKLQETVTLLQSAYLGANSIMTHLNSIEEFIKNLEYDQRGMKLPDSIIQNFIEEKLSCIRYVVKNCRHNGVHVLNGKLESLIKVEGNKLTVVRAGKTDSISLEKKYPVHIYQKATKSFITGNLPLTAQLLSQETSITLIEGSRFIQYQIPHIETLDLFLKSMQEYITDHGLRINVSLDNNNRLVFTHTQYGSQYQFSAISHKTQMISLAANEIVKCFMGKDIQGTVSGETLCGNGNFLISPSDNSLTGGMILYFQGEIQNPGQIAGYLQIEHQGWKYPVNETDSNEIFFPCLLPERMGVGVENDSGISHLGDVKVKNKRQCHDFIFLVQWAIEDIETLIKKWKKKELDLVDYTLDLVKEYMALNDHHNEIFDIPSNKVKVMSFQLKQKLMEQHSSNFMV